jgi:DNA-binding MarR family transcriptional regulator
MSDGAPAGGLTGETLEVWASLATLLEWLPPALDAPLLRDAGLTHFEYGILYALADAPDSTLRMSELAGYANSSLTRLSRAISRLEKRGWVLRRPDPTDGRYTLAVLLDEGQRVFRAATPGHERNVQGLVFDPLTHAQQLQLGEICRRILGAIREEEGWQKR